MAMVNNSSSNFNSGRNLIMLLGISFLLSIQLSSCRKLIEDNPIPEVKNGWENHIPFIADYQTTDLNTTDLFEILPQSMGQVSMRESSGIAWSRENPQMIWAHNDSGDQNLLYLIRTQDGSIAATYRISGAAHVDWEDIEVGPGPDSTQSFIYISDTGDNSQIRQEYAIYRFPEPIFNEADSGMLIDIAAADKLRFKYPDKSHDAESLLIDSLTKDIFLVTKRDLRSILFVLPYPQHVDSLSRVYKAGTFAFTQASAANASPNGQFVAIKNRQEIFLWERKPGESFVNMLSRTPEKAPYSPEPQGESICFDEMGNYYTLSEAAAPATSATLYKYSKQK